METLQQLLKNIELSTAQIFGALTVIPLVRSVTGSADYWTLDEAMAHNWVTITEVSEAGAVPELLCSNTSDRSVLLLDGEEVERAKQNRIFNLTLLVPAHTNLNIPVSCVEQGRWRYRSRTFKTAKHTYHASGRAKKIQQVTRALKQQGRPYADQHQIWAEVDEHLEVLECDSPTSAMADLYAQELPKLADYTAAFQAITNQVGAIFALNGQIWGLELFDFPSTFAQLLPKLLPSYALEVRGVPDPTPLAPQAVTDFLQNLSQADAETFPALAEGLDIRLSSPTVVGSALVAKERVIHVSAFPNTLATETY